MNTIAEKVFETVKALPEQQAGEVLSFAEALRTKREEAFELAKQKALAMLDDPLLALNGRYWSRDSLYDRR